MRGMIAMTIKKELLKDLNKALSYFTEDFRLTKNYDKQLELINYLADLTWKYDEITINNIIYDVDIIISEVCEDLNSCYFERAAYHLLTLKNTVNNG